MEMAKTNKQTNKQTTNKQTNRQTDREKQTNNKRELKHKWLETIGTIISLSILLGQRQRTTYRLHILFYTMP